MTQEQLKTKIDDLIQAIREYRQEKDFDEIDLERAIDYMLTRLPRDIVYVEWYDRSDIASRIDYDGTITEELLDMCIHNMWNTDESIMDDEFVMSIVDDTVEEYKKTKEQK